MNDWLKLLDNGWRVVIYKNALDSYTARAYRQGESIEEDSGEFDSAGWWKGPSDDDEHIIDADTPAKAIDSLAKKVFQRKST